MSDVGQVTSTTQTSSTTSSSSSGSSANAADYDAFLTLLVAELKNQDPTEPKDSAQYLAQLASFSSVEQQIQTNDKLNSLIQSNLLGQATDVIGHKITSADGELSGTVVSVELTKDGLLAKLDNGATMPITNGVVIQ